MLVGVLAVADVPNANGHVYSRATLERFIPEMKKHCFVCDKLDDQVRVQLQRVGAEVVETEMVNEEGKATDPLADPPGSAP